MSLELVAYSISLIRPTVILSGTRYPREDHRRRPRRGKAALEITQRSDRSLRCYPESYPDVKESVRTTELPSRIESSAYCGARYNEHCSGAAKPLPFQLVLPLAKLMDAVGYAPDHANLRWAVKHGR